MDNYDTTLATFNVNSSTPEDVSPEINSITITPNSINNRDTVTVLINTTDDVSGVERIQVDMKNPNGEQEHTAFGQIGIYNL